MLSIDGEKKHFRVAAYGEVSTVRTAHDEAEPDLQENNGGYGGGIIVTKLQNRYAASFTTGVMMPNTYTEAGSRPNFAGQSTDYTIEMIYGRALVYNLSLGYLLYPRTYKSYYQPNYNVYVEFLGRSYGAATVLINNERIEANAPALVRGDYIEAHVGIQKIINSNFRLNLSIGFPVFRKSYTRFYPVDMISAQRYFYFE